MSMDKQKGEAPATQNALGIMVKVVRSEARDAPCLTRNEDDTVDFYVIEVTWRQALYGKQVWRWACL